MHKKFTSVHERMPEVGVPVRCRLRSAVGEIVEYDLIRVKEDNCTWRTADDRSELSYAWDVIEWSQLQDQQVREKGRTVMSQPFSSGWDSLDHTDWGLLYEQKRALVKLLLKDGVSISGDLAAVTTVDGSLEGILNLLDSVMDEAAEKGIFQYPEEEAGPGR